VHRRPDAHELLITIEKPVIARVNVDAIGFGMSLLWACDVVVARDDARIAWGTPASAGSSTPTARRAGSRGR
jgi:enoyl-CoA hydratase/carnithine racemase